MNAKLLNILCKSWLWMACLLFATLAWHCIARMPIVGALWPGSPRTLWQNGVPYKRILLEYFVRMHLHGADGGPPEISRLLGHGCESDGPMNLLQNSTAEDRDFRTNNSDKQTVRLS